MPEGDTVYLTAKRQHEALSGKALTASDLRVPAFATVELAGETVHEVASRGKHLLHRIGAWTLHSHLKMEGSWKLFRDGARWTQPEHRVRAVLEVPGVQAVGFSLGICELVRREEEDTVVGHLGPDLLGADWDADEALRRLTAHPEVPIFQAIQEQRNLAGVGNEYANEICFLRGLDPHRPVGEVADLPAVVTLARRLLLANKDRWIRCTTGDLRPGRTSWVFGRMGQRCRRCGTPLREEYLGRSGQERRVHWCPSCQR